MTAFFTFVIIIEGHFFLPLQICFCLVIQAFRFLELKSFTGKVFISPFSHGPSLGLYLVEAVVVQPHHPATLHRYATTNYCQLKNFRGIVFNIS